MMRCVVLSSQGYGDSTWSTLCCASSSLTKIAEEFQVELWLIA